MTIHGRARAGDTGADGSPLDENDIRWQAIVRRDGQARGFVYGVITTGVYCRPGCASRLPRRENVRFFASPGEAERVGFRPCKRCAPGGHAAAHTHDEVIARACRAIEDAEEPPSLEALASAAGLSPWHFQRLFKRTVGVTPKQYAMEKRLGRARDGLRQGASVTDAAYGAGYPSGGRFYDEAPSGLGMRPSAYRDGGRGVTIRYTTAPSYLGWVLVAATDRGICSIELGDAPAGLEARLRARFPAADLTAGDQAFAALAGQVLAAVESPRWAAGQAVTLPLDIQGTAFQRRVWQALRQVPAGATTTYGAVAAGIGQPKAVRAVAGACAANPVAVAIPCHRVKRGNGEPGGYRWGVERKRALLEREAAGDGSTDCTDSTD